MLRAVTSDKNTSIYLNTLTFSETQRGSCELHVVQYIITLMRRVTSRTHDNKPWHLMYPLLRCCKLYQSIKMVQCSVMFFLRIIHRNN